MTQYKIPQKTQREDKILGPLTAKQLLYGMITLGGSYVLFSMINLNPVFYFNLIERVALTIPFFILGLAFTMLEINERPFEIYFWSLLNFLFAAKIRVWQKEPVIVEYTAEAVPQTVTSTAIEAAAAAEPENKVSRDDIRRLSTLIDKPELADLDSMPGLPTRTLDMLSKLDKEAKPDAQPMQVLAKGDRKFNVFNMFKPVQDMLFGNKPGGDKAGAKNAGPSVASATTIADAPIPSADELSSLLQKKPPQPPQEAPAANQSPTPIPHEVSIEDILNQHKQDKAGDA